MRFTVKVGFISRTVDWQRVDAVPAGPDAVIAVLDLTYSMLFKSVGVLE